MKGTRVPQPILLRRSTLSARDAPPIGGMQTVSRLGFPYLVQQSPSMVPFRSPECPTPAWNSTEGAPEKTRPDRPLNAACRSATTGIHDAVPAESEASANGGTFVMHPAVTQERAAVNRRPLPDRGPGKAIQWRPAAGRLIGGPLRPKPLRGGGPTAPTAAYPSVPPCRPNPSRRIFPVFAREHAARRDHATVASSAARPPASGHGLRRGGSRKSPAFAGAGAPLRLYAPAAGRPVADPRRVPGSQCDEPRRSAREPGSRPLAAAAGFVRMHGDAGGRNHAG